VNTTSPDLREPGDTLPIFPEVFKGSICPVPQRVGFKQIYVKNGGEIVDLAGRGERGLGWRP
jgi:hypothetical protein